MSTLMRGLALALVGLLAPLPQLLQGLDVFERTEVKRRTARCWGCGIVDQEAAMKKAWRARGGCIQPETAKIDLFVRKGLCAREQQ